VRIALGLDDADAADGDVVADRDRVDAAVAAVGGLPGLEAHREEQVADEAFEVEGVHGGEVHARVRRDRRRRGPVDLRSGGVGGRDRAVAVVDSACGGWRPDCPS
jgi:hypothetical protein